MSSFSKCKSYSHFFSKNISIYAIFDDQSLNDMSTNNIVSFEQVGPDRYKFHKLDFSHLSKIFANKVQINSLISVKKYLESLNANTVGRGMKSDHNNFPQVGVFPKPLYTKFSEKWYM